MPFVLLGLSEQQLAKNLNLRNTPEIHFILDQSIEYGVNMSKLIDDVVEKDGGFAESSIGVEE